MSREALGRLLMAVGVVVVLVGIVGALTSSGSSPAEPVAASPSPEEPTAASPSPEEPTAASTSPTTDAPPPAPATFAGSSTDPAADVYACAEGGVDGDEPRSDILAVEYRASTPNPVTGADGSSLLLTVADAFLSDAIGAHALVLLDTDLESLPSDAGPDDLHGTQLRMTFVAADPPFAKSLRTWDGATWVDLDAAAYNARFEGFEDRVEFEFFAPPGTAFLAALVTDTASCDLALP